MEYTKQITLSTQQTTQKLLAKMKKNYTSPAIETTEVLVEQGIAQSTVLIQGEGFGLDEANYTESTFEW